MKDLVNLKVDEDLIVDVINKQIQSAIVTQLGNKSEIVGQAVAYALSRKVDSSGRVSQYSSDNTHDYLDVMSSNAIQDAAKEALQSWLKESTKKIKSAVLKELKKPERQQSIAKSFADAVEDSLNCSWNMNCSIAFKENSRS